METELRVDKVAKEESFARWRKDTKTLFCKPEDTQTKFAPIHCLYALGYC